MGLEVLFSEAFAGLMTRPARFVLATLAAVVGIASAVVFVGLTRTAENQFVSDLGSLQGDVLVVVAAEPFNDPGGQRSSAIPWDAEARVKQLDGVVAAGTLSVIEPLQVSNPLTVVNPELSDVPVFAGSAGLFSTVNAKLTQGRFFDGGHDERASTIAVLSKRAAARLGIERIDNLTQVVLSRGPTHVSLTVAGIYDDVAAAPSLSSGIIIPEGTARSLFDLVAPSEVRVSTEGGMAPEVARRVPGTLSPEDPGSFDVLLPPQPSGAVGVLSIVFLCICGLGIAAQASASISERTPEIGLRRVLGAAKRHIAAQVLLETGIIGILGGAIGASIGIGAIVVVAVVQRQTPIIDFWLAPVAIVLGATIGLISGAFPSWRAARIQPVDALRAANLGRSR